MYVIRKFTMGMTDKDIRFRVDKQEPISLEGANKAANDYLRLQRKHEEASLKWAMEG